MASIDYLGDRRMHSRNLARRDEQRMTNFHTALSLFLVVLAIMLMLSVAYFYATYVGQPESALLIG